jgi:hypothetical protein
LRPGPSRIWAWPGPVAVRRYLPFQGLFSVKASESST